MKSNRRAEGRCLHSVSPRLEAKTKEAHRDGKRESEELRHK